MCHIAITPLIYEFEVTMKDIDLSQLLPLQFQRCYQLNNTPEFFKEELLIHIFTTRNVAQLPHLTYIKMICLGNQNGIDSFFMETLKNI